MNESAEQAPEIEGFTVVKHIGSGGSADVYEYVQHRPERRVAIKVLKSDAIDESARIRFANEADNMAAVSGHPHIVQIFAEFEASGGRPCIVMELYPGPTFLERYLVGSFSVAEAVRVGIQLSGAVESAHRSGIQHRDITPSNVLTSSYGEPGLTDFGIAAAGGHAVSSGMSVLWASPEAIVSDGEIDERSDVYGLAATVYTLLAGRAPFQRDPDDLAIPPMLSRIRDGKLVAMTRSDVPDSLISLLRNGLSVSPDLRIPSALSFGSELAEIERSLGLGATAIHLIDPANNTTPSAGGHPDGRADMNASRRFPKVHGNAAPIVPHTAPRIGGFELPKIQSTVARPQPAQFSRVDRHARLRRESQLLERVRGRGKNRRTERKPKSFAVPRSEEPQDAPREPLTKPGSPHRYALIAIAFAAVAAAAIWAIAAKDSADVDRQRARDRENDFEFDTAVTQPGSIVPSVQNLRSERIDRTSVKFIWEVETKIDGADFVWNRTDPGTDQSAYVTTDTSVLVRLADEREVPCVRVAIRLSNGRTSSIPSENCLAPD